jgi:hypothetical protein
MPWKGHNRHVFLFRNHLVICKPRRDSRTDTFSYMFRNMMKVCGCQGCQGLCRAGGKDGWVKVCLFLRLWSGCCQPILGGLLKAFLGLSSQGGQPFSSPTDAPFHPQLSSIDLNDQVEGDDRAFEVWHEREDSVRKYLLQARTVIIKNSWVKEICGIQQRLALPVWRECPLWGPWWLRQDGEPEPFPPAIQLGCT